MRRVVHIALWTAAGFALPCALCVIIPMVVTFQRAAGNDLDQPDPVLIAT